MESFTTKIGNCISIHGVARQDSQQYRDEFASGLLLKAPFGIEFEPSDLYGDDKASIFFACEVPLRALLRNGCGEIKESTELLKSRSPGITELCVNNPADLAEITISNDSAADVFVPLRCETDKFWRPPKITRGLSRWRNLVRAASVFLVFLIVLNIVLRSNELSQLFKIWATISSILIGTLSILRIQSKIGLPVPYRFLLLSSKRVILFLGITTTFSAVAICLIVQPVLCLYLAYQYQSLISGSLAQVTNPGRITKASRALQIFPERPEAYEIIAKALNEGRYSDRISLSIYAKGILSDSKSIQPIVNFVTGTREPCDCLDYNEANINRRRQILLAWLMFRSAEQERYFKLPADLLQQAFSTIKSDVGNVNLISILAAVQGVNNFTHAELSNMSTDSNAHLRALEEWSDTDLTKQPSGLNAFQLIEQNSYLAQIAYDRLFRSAIVRCDFDMGLSYLSQILTIRERSPDDNTLWLEGAEKLVGLHFVRLLRAKNPTLQIPLYEAAVTLNEHMLKCPAWGENKKRALNVLKNDFPAWLVPSESHWRKGTVEGLSWGHLETRIKKSFSVNWRY